MRGKKQIDHDEPDSPMAVAIVPSLVQYTWRLVKQAFGSTIPGVLDAIGVLAMITGWLLRAIQSHTSLEVPFGITDISSLPLMGYVLVSCGIFVASYQLFRQETELRQAAECAIDEVRQRRPRLRVFFSLKGLSGSPPALRLPQTPPAPDVEALVAQERARLAAKRTGDRVPRVFDVSSVLWRKSSEELARDDEEYLEEYSSYLQDAYDYDIAPGRLLRLQPRIENQGRFPANDIRIEIHLPKGVSVASEQQAEWSEDRETAPSKPEAPSAQTGLASLVPYTANLSGGFHLSRQPDPDDYQIVPRGAQTVLIYTRDHLVPGEMYDRLCLCELWLGGISSSCTLSFTTVVYAAELPKPQQSTLVIEVVGRPAAGGHPPRLTGQIGGDAVASDSSITQC